MFVNLISLVNQDIKVEERVFVVIFLKVIFKFIASFPGYINQTESAAAFCRYSLMIQDKLVELFNLLMTRPVDPFYLLIQFFNVIGMYKVPGNNFITGVDLLYNKQTKLFRILIFKIIRNLINMMIKILKAFYKNIIDLFPEPGLLIYLNHLVLNRIKNMVYDIRINITLVKKNNIIRNLVL